MRALAFLLLLALPLSGCADDPDSGGDDSGLGEEPPMDSPAPSPPIEWADPAQAAIRPGVQVGTSEGQCTSNFIFTSPDNATVYVGLAAHCFGTSGDPTMTDGCEDGNGVVEIGSSVEIDGASQPGTVAYISWATMQNVSESDASACAYNDFALVALHPDDVNRTNPAMLRFGGPTRVANSTEVQEGDKVLTYGNSGLRFGLAPLSPKEGVVTQADQAGGWTTTVYTVTPGVPGDSGSGVLLGDGQGLGILVTLSGDGSNGVTSLDKAMAYAAETGGIEVRLATWDQLDDGVLPL